MSSEYDGARVDGFLTPSHLCPDSSALDVTSGTMVLQVHPAITSDPTPVLASDSDTGVLHVSSSDLPAITLQYWIRTRSIIPTLTQYGQEAGYNVFYFTPFSTDAM